MTAIRDVLDSMTANQVCELVDLPYDHKHINNQVLKVKLSLIDLLINMRLALW